MITRQVVNGRNPIVAHEFLGSNVEGKDVIVIDDMISSGESMIDVASTAESTACETNLPVFHLWSVHQRYGKIRRGLQRGIF